jgi:pectin methylesterase-like acyl-CoA thioesterase
LITLLRDVDLAASRGAVVFRNCACELDDSRESRFLAGSPFLARGYVSAVAEAISSPDQPAFSVTVFCSVNVDI